MKSILATVILMFLIAAPAFSKNENKKYAHRLMDFNNDSATKFKDIVDVLTTTKMRLVKRLKETE